MGTIQGIDAGEQVHANQSSPVGIKIAEIQTIETMASGGTLPVSGSCLWLLIMRRTKGSQAIMIKQPTPMPQKARPDRPRDQPRIWRKTMGYAVKQR